MKINLPLTKGETCTPPLAKGGAGGIFIVIEKTNKKEYNEKDRGENDMHMTINIPDSLPREKVLKKIKEIEEVFAKEAKFLERKQENAIEKAQSADPWDNLNIDKISVDTGIEDFAENHDHYLYGNPKRL
ncbi:MAG: hypothetical protein ACE5EA_07825 [Nitrospirota bacterium]